MLAKYPATTVALIGVLVFALAVVVLVGPTLRADPAQIAIIVGVLVVAIQQLISQRTNEANGHRLTAVEQSATESVSRLDSLQPPVE